MSSPDDAEELLERSNELSALAGWLEAVANSNGRLVLVRGEAGIGKTTLLHEFCERNRDHERAAGLWVELGCPYEAALALAGADDDDALRGSLAELQALGAAPAAAIVARRLRERRARGLPRGPRATTRQNPAGLTTREVEVLGLVAQGLRNAEIGGRLFVSEKTVGHHVSAILRKLDVRTRSEAGAAAIRLGIADPR